LRVGAVVAVSGREAGGRDDVSRLQSV
jgi:hypothetical protein